MYSFSIKPFVVRADAFCVLHAPNWANGLFHWEGLCAAAPFTAGGDCPPGFRASGRRPGSRRTAVAPSTPAAAASYARRRHHPLKWACDSNAQSSAMRAVHCHTASRGRWIRKACKFPRTERPDIAESWELFSVDFSCASDTFARKVILASGKNTSGSHAMKNEPPRTPLQASGSSGFRNRSGTLRKWKGQVETDSSIPRESREGVTRQG